MAESNGNNLSSRERNLSGLPAGKNARLEHALTWCKEHKIKTRLNLLDLESEKDQEKKKKRGKLLSKKAK